MGLTYLKTALRSLLRNRAVTAINIVCLALGIASCLLIGTYLLHEWTWEAHLPNGDRIYRAVGYNQPDNGDSYYNSSVPHQFAELLDGRFSTSDTLVGALEPAELRIAGVQAVARGTEQPIYVVQGDGQIEAEVYYADDALFDLLGLPVLRGSASDALRDMHATVITESAARKYLGTADAVGQTLLLRDEGDAEPYRVAAVIADPPANSRFEADLYLPFQHAVAQRQNFVDGSGWAFSFSSTWIKLAPGTDPEVVEAGIAALLNGIGLDEHGNQDGHYDVLLQPLRDVHIALSNPRDLPVDMAPVASMVLLAIGIAILIIAGMNFTTLSIARSTNRAREVGVRKVMGARRGMLMNQFLIENAVVVGAAMLVAILLAELAMPVFTDFVQRQLELRFTPPTLLVMVAFWLLVVLGAGSYPALVLSRFRTVEAFRGSVRIGGKRRLRWGLVFVQFSISIALIAGMLVMDQQLNFIQSRGLGYRTEQVVELPVGGRGSQGREAMQQMRQELAGNPQVLSVTGSACTFGTPWFHISWTDRATPDREWEDFYYNTVDHAYLSTLGIPVIEGRDFDPERPTDAKEALIVNEAYVREMGLENPIGSELPGGGWATNQIIGVIPDIHFLSLHEEIRPLILVQNPRLFLTRGISLSAVHWFDLQRVYVRLAPGSLPGVMETIEDTWNTVAPDREYNPLFLDENVRQQYAEEQRWSHIITWSGALAIVIAVLGLLGLSALEVAQRTKEIGIRKVLGATTRSILLLLVKPITLLVAAATLVGLPVAWMFGQRWLTRFAYHAELDLIPFLAAGAAALLLAWVTVGVLAVRASRNHPVRSLRVE